MFFRGLIAGILLSCTLLNGLRAQGIQLLAGQNISNASGDDLFPAWSKDGNQLVFQSNRNGNWDIYLFISTKDTLQQLTHSPENEQHPIWVNRGTSVVYDTDGRGGVRLQKLSMTDGHTGSLFDRELPAKQASFTSGEKLVYFSGYDNREKQWKIYSYEFYYNNLNELSELNGQCLFPKVSPDTDWLLFTHQTDDFPQKRLHLVNWYGNPELEFGEFNIVDPSWGPNGLKIFFVSNKDHKKGEIYSMWKDGSHLERLTYDSLEVRTPVVSPDGKKLAVSLRLADGFDIFLISLEDY